jgi:hypothetical protein
MEAMSGHRTIQHYAASHRFQSSADFIIIIVVSNFWNIEADQTGKIAARAAH